MKIIIIPFLIGILSLTAQENVATTLRLGDFKLYQNIDEVEKGYYLNDVIIRYAKVVVGE